MTYFFVQPALPAYRKDFFARVASHFKSEFGLHYAGGPSAISADILGYCATCTGPERRLPLGFVWQRDVVNIQLVKGSIIVLSGNPRYLSTLVLALKAKLRGANVIWWSHYWSSSSRSWRMALRLMLMRIADGVVFYTDQEVAEYRAGPGKCDKRPVIGLNNGINTDPIRALRTSYDAEQRQQEILFVGRQTAKAKLSLLIKALAMPHLSGVHLHVVGEGEESEKSRAVAKAVGVENRITWHGVTTDEADIAPIANRCRMFVYPGEVGLSLIHGMAYGLPCVVHSDRWQHMPEIAAFKDGQTGRSFSPNDDTALADAIAALIDDVDSLNDMSQRCCAVTDASFNTQDMAKRLTTFLESFT